MTYQELVALLKEAAVDSPEWDAALLLEQLQQRLVLGLAGNDNHIVEVLGSGTDKADATYINLLDNISLASTTGHGLLERIEVHDNQIDLGNLILLHLLTVTLQVSASQNTTKYLGMKGLYTTTEDAGIRCYILNLYTRNTETLNE